ncbi:MAG: hypothetical protein RQ754_02225 [Desulfuromonadales bacterium]|nr:hypothetical protein [Desulfuromonadales bacterium]
MLQLFSTRKAHLDACILRRIVLIMLALLALSHSGCAVTEKMSPPGINDGAGFFYFKDKATATGDAMRVFYYKPRGFTADRPVLFFMHGADRRAEHIPGAAAELLEKFNILLILPEFSEELFPGIESYQYGNVGTKPRALWSFPVNDRIFRYVRQITGSHQQKYYVWGNSAGAQFVHRQILLGVHQYIEKAFASNAGVYTLPTNGDDPYPFSIKGLGLTNEELREVFSVDFFVLLGEQDLARDAYFLQSRPAMKQGGNRLQRGRLFYATAASEARGRGLDFNWTLITFPGCGHEPDDAMITKVISLILDSPN